MRIAYVNHGRFPTEKAHGFQTAQVCEALLDLGHEVTLYCPTFQNPITAAAQQYYGLRRPLSVQSVGHFDAFRSRFIPGFLGFIVSMRSYGKAIQRHLSAARFDLLYTRSPLLLGALLRANIPLILELHAIPRFGKRRFAAACNRCRSVVCLTSPMGRALVALGVDRQKIVVEPDGVDLRRFQGLPEPAAAKWRWKLPADRPVIGYVGSLSTRETLEKGVRELIDAMALLKRSSPDRPLLWIVGGPQRWKNIYEEFARSKGLTAADVRFEGHVDASAVPAAIAACDVCVYPAPKANHPYFVRDTSPLKLFEYLCSGRPVICADLPPVRDVVSEKHVRFFRAGDSSDLAAAIIDTLAHPQEALARAQTGLDIIQKHSWTKRMQRILEKM